MTDDNDLTLDELLADWAKATPVEVRRPPGGPPPYVWELVGLPESWSEPEHRPDGPRDGG